MNEELLVGAGNASTAAAAGKCGESNPLTSVTWATSTPGTIPVGEALETALEAALETALETAAGRSAVTKALETALRAVAYGAGTAKALTGWPWTGDCL